MKAVAYACYSMDRQTSNSIVYQIEKILEYSWQNNNAIVAIYADEAESDTY